MEKDGTTTAPVAKTDAPAERGTAALPDPIRPSAPAPPHPIAPSPPDPVALAQLWADQFQHLTTISLAGAGGMLILVETGGLRAKHDVVAALHLHMLRNRRRARVDGPDAGH